MRKYFDKLPNIELNPNYVYIAAGVEFIPASSLNPDKPLKPSINLVMDTTYFGLDFGVMVFRGNPVEKSKFINLRWKYLKSETVTDYHHNIYAIVQKYKVKSFTVDNKSGLMRMLEKKYPSTPVQLCQFHMVSGIVRLTTRHPKSQCGKDLLNLVFQLKKSTKKEFKLLLREFLHNHIDYLQQRNHTGKYIHEDLRQAAASLIKNLEYLFTYEKYPDLNIPKTTNSAEGSFGQWKYKIRLHRGLSNGRKVKMINELLKDTGRSQ